MAHGWGGYIDKAGHHYEGYFDEGRFHGSGQYIMANGTSIGGVWNKGVLAKADLRAQRYRVGFNPQEP